MAAKKKASVVAATGATPEEAAKVYAEHNGDTPHEKEKHQCQCGHCKTHRKAQ